MRTANPALNKKTFEGFKSAADSSQTMTINGTVNKTGLMLVMLVISASWVWNKSDMAQIYPWMIGGAIGGFIVALITVFKQHLAPITAPFYAVLEGFFIGGISLLFERMYPGIVLQAVGLTFGTLFCLLLAYRSGLIKVTENFKLGIAAATGGIFVVYMFSMILGFFGTQIPFIHGSGLIGIGFSLFVVVIAAMNLVLDFDFIESGAEKGAPKFMEWYAAFGLMVTLIWLYIEILRLLAKLASRR